MDFNLQEECQNLIEVGYLPWILDPLIPPSKVGALLVPMGWRELLTMSCSKDAIEALANSPENITDHSVFDVYRSYLKCAKI